MDFIEYIKEKFPYKNIRNPQKKMMFKIYNSIINRKHLIIEAPTGVGKTLAYLIPSLYFAERGKRIAILTETIDQQLRIYEDLKTLKHSIKVSFFMGKHNYYCKSKKGKANRLYCQLNRKCIYKPNRKPICYCGASKIMIKFGEKILYYCPFCTCEYQKNKIESVLADIVVMNNSIFYHSKEELEKKRGFDIIICDEAHKLEDSIRRSATIEINFDNIINRLKYMAMYYAPSLLKKRLNPESDRFWEIIENYLESKNVMLDICRSDIIYNGVLTSNYYNLNLSILGAILDGYKQILGIREIVNSFDDNKEIDKKDLYFDFYSPSLINIEMDFVENKNLDLYIAEFIENINNLRFIDENYVVYKNKEQLICEPVFINHVLKSLYADATVIHCSATIGNIKLHAYKTGLSEYDYLILENPFPRDRRMIIALKDGVNMKYEIKDRDKANYILLKLLEAINGNTLILFKSFEDLYNFHNYLKENIRKINIKNKNIHVYEQGMDGKDAKELKERFIEIGGIMLATGRFSEGVDIPGEALIGVIIDALPFPVPTPLLMREQSYLMERGFSKWQSFLMTSFDKMAKTLIQMIGRLIRTENDYGVVVIQDQRFYRWVGKVMKEKGYLKEDYSVMGLDEALKEIPKFINKFRSPYS